jgi:hypothetical protein
VGARTADGCWEWTGEAWTRNLTRRGEARPLTDGSSWPIKVVIAHLGWLVALALWVIALTAVALAIGPNGHPAPAVGITLWALVAIAIGATVCFGGWLASQRRWRQLGFAAVMGAIFLLAWFAIAAAALDTANPQPGVDDATAVGLMFAAVPTFMLLALLLGVGSLVAVSAQTVRRRIGRRPETTAVTP